MLFKGRSEILNVSPTDIDGYIQLDRNNVFVFFELKHHGDAPCGQKTALTTMVDTLRKGHGNAVLIIATHNTPAGKTIIARDAIVTATYSDGEWKKYSSGRVKLMETIEAYINKCEMHARIDRWIAKWE